MGMEEYLSGGFLMSHLSSLSEGDVFCTGKHEWVVLEQFYGCTAVLHKDVLDNQMKFDEETNNWSNASLRKFLNSEFANEIITEVGRKNICNYASELVTDNGTEKYRMENYDIVSLLSCDNYRKYYKFIPKASKWWWTLTPVSSSAQRGENRLVRFADENGILNHCECNRVDGGVRPYCIFKSDTFVTTKFENEDILIRKI